MALGPSQGPRSCLTSSLSPWQGPSALVVQGAAAGAAVSAHSSRQRHMVKGKLAPSTSSSPLPHLAHPRLITPISKAPPPQSPPPCLHQKGHHHVHASEAHARRRIGVLGGRQTAMQMTKEVLKILSIHPFFIPTCPIQGCSAPEPITESLGKRQGRTQVQVPTPKILFNYNYFQKYKVDFLGIPFQRCHNIWNTLSTEHF